MGMSVEIVCALSQKNAQTVVSEHFKETGDRLLARVAHRSTSAYHRYARMHCFSPACAPTGYHRILPVCHLFSCKRLFESVTGQGNADVWFPSRFR